MVTSRPIRIPTHSQVKDQVNSDQGELKFKHSFTMNKFVAFCYNLLEFLLDSKLNMAVRKTVKMLH